MPSDGSTLGLTATSARRACGRGRPSPRRQAAAASRPLRGWSAPTRSLRLATRRLDRVRWFMPPSSRFSHPRRAQTSSPRRRSEPLQTGGARATRFSRARTSCTSPICRAPPPSQRRSPTSPPSRLRRCCRPSTSRPTCGFSTPLLCGTTLQGPYGPARRRQPPHCQRRAQRRPRGRRHLVPTPLETEYALLSPTLRSRGHVFNCMQPDSAVCTASPPSCSRGALNTRHKTACPLSCRRLTSKVPRRPRRRGGGGGGRGGGGGGGGGGRRGARRRCG